MAKQTLADKLAKKILAEDRKEAKAEEKAAARLEKQIPAIEKRLSKL